MFKKKLAQLTIAFSLLFTTGLAFAPVAAQAASLQGDACSGINALHDSASTTCPSGGDTSIRKLLTLVVNIMSLIIGFVSVLMVMIGGFKIITANGDSSDVANGRNTVIYALVGLAIAVLAQVLVHFVLHQTIKAT